MIPRIRSASAALVVASSLFLPVQADGQFGRHRFRYEPHEFQRLSTEHLDLYHAPGMEGVASDAARLAEILQRVSRLGTDGAFIAVTGRDTRALGEEWGREMRRGVPGSDGGSSVRREGPGGPDPL